MENNLVNLFSPTLAELQEIAQKFKGLKINGVEDKEGQKAVKEARITLKNLRVQIQKTGKQAREDALAYQKAVIAKEKEFVEIVELVEKELQDEEDRIEREIEMEKRKKQLPERLKKIEEKGLVERIEESRVETEDLERFLLSMDDKTFDTWILGLEQEKFNEEQAKLLAEKEKLEQEKRDFENAKRREAELEQVRKDAEIRAKRDFEIKQEKEKLAEDQRIKDQIEREKIEKEKVEASKKYQNFLAKNGITQKNIDDGNVLIVKNGNVVKLYELIDKITL